MSLFLSVSMSACLSTINAVAFHNVDYLQSSIGIDSLLGDAPDHYICILYTNMNASYPFVSMTQIFDMHKADNLYYLLKVMLLPFAPYDSDSFSFVVLNSLHQHWFGKSMSYIVRNVSHPDYFSSYGAVKQSFMDFFEAGRHSWINYKSHYWRDRRRFHVLCVVIRDRMSGFEQILATKKRVRFGNADIREFKISILQKQSKNISQSIQKLNQKWEFVAKYVHDV